MGSDETATATTGCPRVIAYLTGTGCHRDQIISFFCMQIGPRTPSGIGLGSGSRRDRMRPCSGLSGELWIQNLGGSYGTGPQSASKTFIFADPPRWRKMNDPKFKIHHSRSPRHFFTNSAPGKQQQEASVRHTRKSKDTPR